MGQLEILILCKVGLYLLILFMAGLFGYLINGYLNKSVQKKELRLLIKIRESMKNFRKNDLETLLGIFQTEILPAIYELKEFWTKHHKSLYEKVYPMQFNDFTSIESQLILHENIRFHNYLWLTCVDDAIGRFMKHMVFVVKNNPNNTEKLDQIEKIKYLFYSDDFKIIDYTSNSATIFFLFLHDDLT